jgi:Putative MetA-pathway of phenol degradation
MTLSPLPTTASALAALFAMLWMSPGALLAAPSVSFDDALVTDRPDAAESSQTVGKLRVQIETGVDLESTSSSDAKRRSLRIPTKLRLGLIDALEIHLESDTFAYDTLELGATSRSETGATDLDLGMKWHIADGGGWAPSLGLLVAVSLPLGAEAFTDDIYALSPTLAAEWELFADVGLGTNLGVTTPLTGRDGHDDSLRFAAAIGRSWDPLSERLGSFIEVFGETPLRGEGDPEVYIDGGFTYLLTPELQLDLNARIGLTKAAADVGGGLGLAARF